jgi:hypothetical protein
VLKKIHQIKFFESKMSGFNDDENWDNQVDNNEINKKENKLEKITSEESDKNKWEVKYFIFYYYYY